MVYVFGLCLIIGLFILSWIDIKTYTLPNLINYFLLVLGFIQAYFLPLGLVKSLFGAVIGYVFFVILAWAYKHFRSIDGLGRGDAKLLAVGGAWCGFFTLPHIMLISSMSALFFILLMKINQRTRIPFGPFLSIGILVTWLFIQI